MCFQAPPTVVSPLAEDFILKITALILLAWTAYELIKKKIGF
jgi:hypothetical protein